MRADDPRLAQVGEFAAHRFLGQPQIVGDVAPAHRQRNQIRPVAAAESGAALNIRQEAREPFRRGLAAERHHPFLRDGQFGGRAPIARLGQRRIMIDEPFEPPLQDAAQGRVADRLGREAVALLRLEADEIAWKQKGDDLPAAVRQDRVKLDDAAGQAEHAVGGVALVEQRLPGGQVQPAPLVAEIGQRLDIQRAAQGLGADVATAAGVVLRQHRALRHDRLSRGMFLPAARPTGRLSQSQIAVRLI